MVLLYSEKAYKLSGRKFSVILVCFSFLLVAKGLITIGFLQKLQRGVNHHGAIYSKSGFIAISSAMCDSNIT